MHIHRRQLVAAQRVDAAGGVLGVLDVGKDFPGPSHGIIAYSEVNPIIRSVRIPLKC